MHRRRRGRQLRSRPGRRRPGGARRRRRPAGVAGLLAGARCCRLLAPRPVITAPAFHLGPVRHMEAAEAGYDEGGRGPAAGPDALGDRRLPAVRDQHAGRIVGLGLFGPAESSSSFACADVGRAGRARRALRPPGGGLVNHDLYRRACTREGIELVVMLDEGRSTSITAVRAPPLLLGRDGCRVPAITGAHRPPATVPLYVGRVHPAPPPLVERSARQAISRLASHGT